MTHKITLFSGIKRRKHLYVRNRNTETNGGSLKIMNKKEFTFLSPPMPDGAFVTDLKGQELAAVNDLENLSKSRISFSFNHVSDRISS